MKLIDQGPEASSAFEAQAKAEKGAFFKVSFIRLSESTW